MSTPITTDDVKKLSEFPSATITDDHMLPVTNPSGTVGGKTTVGAIKKHVIGNIDDEPTAGSDNLVKSGGVFNFAANKFANNYNITYDNIKVYPNKIVIKSNGFAYGKNQIYYIASTSNSDLTIDATWVDEHGGGNESCSMIYIDRTVLSENVRTDFSVALKLMELSSFMTLPNNNDYEPFAVFCGPNSHGNVALVGIFAHIYSQSWADTLRRETGLFYPELGTFEDNDPRQIKISNKRARLRLSVDSFSVIKTSLYEMYYYVFDKDYATISGGGSSTWVQNIQRIGLPYNAKYIHIAFRLQSNPNQDLSYSIDDVANDIHYKKLGTEITSMRIIPFWNVKYGGIYIDGDKVRTNENGFGLLYNNKYYYIAPTDRETSYTFSGSGLNRVLCLDVDKLTTSNVNTRIEPTEALSVVNLDNSKPLENQIPIAHYYKGYWTFIGVFSHFNQEKTLDKHIHPTLLSQSLEAHRGYDVNAPENTIPAFEAAKNAGFKIIETDIVESSDGVQFCLHDATIDRTSNGSGRADSYTAAQLKTFDFGSWKGTQWTGTKIPTLKEALLYCKRHGLCVELDLADNSRYSDSMLAETYNVVKKCGMLHQCIFCAEKSRLEKLQLIDPSVIMSISGVTATSDIDDASVLIAMSRFANVSIPAANITESLIEYAHNANAYVKTWWYAGSISDNVTNVRAAFDLGCDFAITGKVTPSDL